MGKLPHDPVPCGWRHLCDRHLPHQHLPRQRPVARDQLRGSGKLAVRCMWPCIAPTLPMLEQLWRINHSAPMVDTLFQHPATGPEMPAWRASHPLLQAVGVKPDKTQSPPSNEDIVTMPSLPGPIITSAKPWGPTTGQALATAPEGVSFSEVTESGHEMCRLNTLQLGLSGICQEPVDIGYAVNVCRTSPSTTFPLPLRLHFCSTSSQQHLWAAGSL